MDASREPEPEPEPVGEAGGWTFHPALLYVTSALCASDTDVSQLAAHFQDSSQESRKVPGCQLDHGDGKVRLFPLSWLCTL